MALRKTTSCGCVLSTHMENSKSYKEEWKRKLVVKNPNRKASGKPPIATALELLRVSEYIKRHCHELEVIMLMCMERMMWYVTIGLLGSSMNQLQARTRY